MTLEAFLARYPPHAPAFRPRNEDEARQLTDADGVKRLEVRPHAFSSCNVPSKKGDPGCHLWVIHSHGVPYILEVAPIAPALQSGRVTHTNLTGGGNASSGGEVW